MFRLLKRLFSRKPKAPRARKDAVIYRLGGGWGNRIEWLSHDKVAGWKTPKPRKGDVLWEAIGDGYNEYLFLEVENCWGVPDMFFGQILHVGFRLQQGSFVQIPAGWTFERNDSSPALIEVRVNRGAKQVTLGLSYL
jgi:hypothetical protein